MLHRWRRKQRIDEVRSKFAAAFARVNAEHRQLHERLREHANSALREESVRFPPEIDVVLSGGGFWSIYGGSLCYALQKNGVKIVRAAGTSAGAHTALMVLRGYEAVDAAFRWAVALMDTLRLEGHNTFMEDLWTQFFAAHIEPPPPPGALTVGITTLTSPFRAKRIDAFESAEDLSDALVATARIPGLFGLAKPRRLHQWALDGGASELCPMFEDGLRPQLVLHWDDLRERYGRINGFGFDTETLYEICYLGIDNAHRLLRGETRVFGASLVRPGVDEPPHVAGLTRMVLDHWLLSLRRRLGLDGTLLRGVGWTGPG